MKVISLLILFLGEGLVIFAEEFGAKRFHSSAQFTQTFYLTLIPLAVGATLLVVGYMLGFKYFGNIWIISALSFGAILILEPLFNFLYIGQLPTLGAGIGALLGGFGMLSALFL